MPTFAEIREQIRQTLKENGESCSASTLKFLCELIAILAKGEAGRFLKMLPSEAEQARYQEGPERLQEEWPDEIQLVRNEWDRLLAEARRQDLNDKAAEKMVVLAFMRDFFQPNYRAIRQMVQEQLAAVEAPPLPISEKLLQRICAQLFHLVLNSSGLTMRKQSTSPLLWGDEGEAHFANLRERLAPEIELLRAETIRLAQAAEARGKRGYAIFRTVKARVNREFIGQPHRRA